MTANKHASAIIAAIRSLRRERDELRALIAEMKKIVGDCCQCLEVSDSRTGVMARIDAALRGEGK